MLKTKVKLNFELQSTNVLYDVVIGAEALNTYGLFALCVDSARLRVDTPEPEVWHGTGKCRHPVGAGRPTGEELGSVTPLGGKVE